MDGFVMFMLKILLFMHIAGELLRFFNNQLVFDYDKPNSQSGILFPVPLSISSAS